MQIGWIGQSCQDNICDMGQISQPNQKNAAAGENKEIGPFKIHMWSDWYLLNMWTIILSSLGSKNKLHIFQTIPFTIIAAKTAGQFDMKRETYYGNSNDSPSWETGMHEIYI